jgi:hypothetical protein
MMRLLQRMHILTVALVTLAFAVSQGQPWATASAGEVVPVHESAEAGTLAQSALDLAAMVIRPNDLSHGEWVQADARMTIGEDQAETEGTGRAYENVLTLPEPTDWDLPRQAIGTTIWEYADDDTATERFDIVVSDLSAAGFEEIAGVPAIGELSDVRRGRCDCGGGPAPDLVVVFVQGRLTARIDLIDFASNDALVAGSYSLSVTVIAELGQIVADHIAAVTANEHGVGLGALVARLGDERHRFDTVSDDYLRLAGVDLPQYLKDRDAAVHIADGFDDATNVYWYGGRVADDSLRYSAYLYRLPSVESASAWLDGGPAALDSFADDVEVQSDALVYGDESTTFRYSYFEGRWHFVRTYLRVGTVVASIDVGTKTVPSPATVEVLVSAQTECLQTGRCGASVALPDHLTDD